MTDEIQKIDLPEIKNKKHELFIKQYIITMSATKAAIACGYKRENARNQGSRLLRKADISLHIQFSLQEKYKKLDIRADNVLREVAAIAFCRISDFVMSVPVADQVSLTLEEHDSDYRKIDSKIHLKSLSEVGDSIAGLDLLRIDKNGSVTIKINGKLKALELLGERAGIWTPEKKSLVRDRKASNERILKAIKKISIRRKDE